MEGKGEKKPSTSKNVVKKKFVETTRDNFNEKKNGNMVDHLKEDCKITSKSPERLSKGSLESLQFSDSKLKKLKSGFGQKIKDIREDIVDIRDESIHSLIEIKEVYQEKAEQKKAILTSFTEDEVRNLRKSSPLAANVTKQMNTLYMSKRLSIVRCSVLGAKNVNINMGNLIAENVFVKFSLGLERFKTRLVPTSSNPGWLETFSLPRQAEEDDNVKVELFARGSKETTILGTGFILLNDYIPDTETRILLNLKGDLQEAQLDLVLWMTGVNAEDNAESATDLLDDEYKISKSLKNISDVGYLTIQVVQATGLGSTKLQGSVNPFCLLELENQFHRTKTLTNIKTPVWGKTFNLKVHDTFSVLKITVANEKMNSPQIVLGRAVVPLSQLLNGQDQDMWINLKDKKLRKAAKGDSPKMHLKVLYKFNRIRSAIATFKNKDEVLYEIPKPKFDRPVLVKNVNRIKRFLPKGSTITKIKQAYTDIIAWEDPARTVNYFVFYMFFVYYFQIWWVPTIMLYYLCNNYRNRQKNIVAPRTTIVKNEVMDEDEDEDEDHQDGKQEEKKSLKLSLDALQTILLEFQEGCGSVGSYFERISNLFYFEEPFLTFLFCCLLAVASLVLWMFGLRAVLLFWGVNKFTKKLRDPNPVPTNELDNLILRVPDFEMVEDSRPV